MAISTATLDTEIGVVLVAVFVVLIGLYALNRYMKRRGPELAVREGRSVLDDRSFNQIRLGQAAAEHLARTGADVGEAKSLLDRAQAARDGGNFGLSIDLAKQAQDKLAKFRAGGSPLSTPPTAAGAGNPKSAPAGAAPKSAPTSVAPSLSAGFTAPPKTAFVASDAPEPSPVPMAAEVPSNRPPKNKMEAHFQLSLARDDVDQARTAKPRNKAFGEAEQLLARGQAAYDGGDFTEGLRLALKCRRALGSRVEGLPMTAAPSGQVPAGAPMPATTQGPGNGANAPTGALACAKCGRAATGADQFCRGCGAPLGPTACINCGAPLTPGDRFCGKCGTVQS